MNTIATQRLNLRPLTEQDTDLVQELYNQPDCLKYIGDKDIHNKEDALRYLRQGPLKSYQDFGFGLLTVTLHSGECVGVCGLLKRPEYEFPDIGYALLSRYQGKGYIKEACQAVLSFYPQYKSILALTNPDNLASQAILLKLGFELDKKLTEQQAERATNCYLFTQ